MEPLKLLVSLALAAVLTLPAPAAAMEIGSGAPTTLDATVLLLGEFEALPRP